MKNEFFSFPRSAKLYLISQSLLAGFYTWPFWYGFASGRISASQFGVYLATGYIVGLIAEIPTGAFADSFGRKRSAMLGALCGILMPLVVYAGGNFSAYLVGAFISGIGGAFISGSLESLIYELPEMTASIYRRVMLHDTFFWQVGLIVATGLGGLMFRVNQLLPFIAQSLSFVMALLVISLIGSDRKEPESKTKVSRQTKSERLLSYVKTNKDGFLHLFAARQIWSLIVFGSALGVVLWMGIEVVNEAAMISYGIQPHYRGLLLSLVKAFSLVVINMIVVRKIISDRQKLTYLATTTLIAFILYSFGGKFTFLLGFLIFNLAAPLNSNFIKPIIHDHIQNRWRATAISSYSFIGNFIQAIIVIIVGVLLQKRDVVFVQRFLLVFFTVVGLTALIRYLPRTKGDRKNLLGYAKSKKKCLIIGSIILLIGLFLPSIYVNASTRSKRSADNNYARIPKHKAAIVLGAGVYANGKPTPYLENRIKTAVELYKADRIEMLLMSGDNGTKHYNEPVAMKRYAVSLGVDENDIYLDYAGFNTYDTCYRAKHIFGINDAIVISQGYHMPRLVYVCNGLGVKSVGVSALHTSRDFTVSYLLRELVATNQAVLQVMFKPQPTVLGPPVQLP